MAVQIRCCCSVEWVRAVCARLGGKVVAVEGLTDVLPMKGKTAKNYPQVW